MTENWNFVEFRTFLLIYASYADLEFTDEERQRILNNVSQETFDKMMHCYDELGDYERLETIMGYKGLYYPTGDQKYELLDQIKKQFLSDGEYSTLEKNLFMFLEKLL